MIAVTLSPKYQVVIPQAVREQLGLVPGERLQVIAVANRIELIPMESPRQLRGFLPGIDTSVPREEDRI